MHRTRKGKRLELTARDIAIFKLLQQYRYLRSTYLHALVGGKSLTRFKERLGDLFHEGYIDRPSQQWQFANARYAPAIYELGAGAQSALSQRDESAGEPRTFLAETAHRQFLHSLMICEVLASLELGILGSAGLRLIPWPEILRKAPEPTRQCQTPFRLPLPSGGYLVPDALFGIEYGSNEAKRYRFFALEADRGTMPVARIESRQTSLLGKVTLYKEALERQIQKMHWGLPNLLVLTIAPSQVRVTNLIERLEAKSRCNAVFLFKAANTSELTAPMQQLFFEPWQRAGFAALAIDV